MHTLDSLLERYHDKLIVVEKKRDSLDILKNLVDIKEIDLNTIHPSQLEIVKQNIKYDENYDDSPIKLHFYEVVENSKSEFYYNELKRTQSMSYIPYFESPTIFGLHEKILGIEETNSELLYRDYVMLRGVTKKDLQEKNRYLFNYLSYISAWEEASRG